MSEKEWLNRKERTKEDIAAKVGNEIYALALKWFEALEHSGRLCGNGHHCAANVADKATLIIKNRISAEEE